MINAFKYKNIIIERGLFNPETKTQILLDGVTNKLNCWPVRFYIFSDFNADSKPIGEAIVIKDLYPKPGSGYKGYLRADIFINPELEVSYGDFYPCIGITILEQTKEFEEKTYITRSEITSIVLVTNNRHDRGLRTINEQHITNTIERRVGTVTVSSSFFNENNFRYAQTLFRYFTPISIERDYKGGFNYPEHYVIMYGMSKFFKYVEEGEQIPEYIFHFNYSEYQDEIELTHVEVKK